MNRLKQWAYVRQLQQLFWSRWSEEYLQTQQRGQKWTRRERDIAIGDVVLVRQENMAPTHWPLGHILEVHPGSDGCVRNVVVHTVSGGYLRPVQKLCILLEENFESSEDSVVQDVR